MSRATSPDLENLSKGNLLLHLLQVLVSPSRFINSISGSKSSCWLMLGFTHASVYIIDL